MNGDLQIVRCDVDDQPVSRESVDLVSPTPSTPGAEAWSFGDADGPIGIVTLDQNGASPLMVRIIMCRLQRSRLAVTVPVLSAAARQSFSAGYVRVGLRQTALTSELALHLAGFRLLRDGHWAAIPVGATTHSVIVGSYNRPRYVKQALRSVIDQYGPNWQLIVTDDQSGDETLAIIRETLAEDPRTHLLISSDSVDDTTRGLTAHVRAVQRINDALPKCYGDIIHYLPDDDCFAPNRFLAFEEVFARPEVHIAYGRLRYMDGDVVSTEDRFPGGPIEEPHCVLDHSQVSHRRSVLERVPRWNDDPNVIGYASDGVFYRSLVGAGYGPIWPIDRLVSFKRRHPFNMLTTQHTSGAQRE